MVTRLAVLVWVAVSVVMLTPAQASAQPELPFPVPSVPSLPLPSIPSIPSFPSIPSTTNPSPSTPGPSTPGDGQQPDLYKPCRDVGDQLPSVLGSIVEGGCDVFQAGTNPGDAAGELMKGVVGKAAVEFAEGWRKGIALMFSWWYRTPLTSSTSTDATADVVGRTHSYLRFFQICAFVVSMGIALVRLAWASAQLRSQQAKEAATLLARSVFVSSSLVGLVVLGDDAMRAASVWLLEQMAGGVDPSQAVDKLLKVAEFGGGLGAGLLFVFALLGVMGVVAQMVFILVQIAVSKLVLGTLPLAAAWSGTEAGMQAYRKLMAWILVFLLFPFITALVYGIAFSLAAGAQDAQGTLAGMILLTLSCLTLPALVRLLVPVAGQMAGGSGAAAMGGALMATGAVPLLGGAMRGFSQAGGGEQPSGSGGRSDGGGDAPSGAVPIQSSSSAGSGGGTGGEVSGATGSQAAGASSSGAASAAGGPIAMAAGAAKERIENIGAGMGTIAADGAARGTGSPDVPTSAGPSGAAPPSGGRSDGTN